MAETKKRIVITLAIAGAGLLLILFSVLYFITQSFVFDAILHTYVGLLLASVAIKVLQKCFKNQITVSMRKALILCSVAVIADLVVVDAIRYILFDGNSTILFIPACFPIILMIILYYSSKDTGLDKKAVSRFIYLLGIPLLLVSLFTEVLSFID